MSEIDDGDTETFCNDAFEIMMKRQKVRHELESSSDQKDNNPLTWGVIYEWVLDKEEFVPRDYPLFGISYIGQVVRAGLLPHKAFEERCKDHITGANRKDKDLGFLHVLKLFGERAFSRRIVEQKELPRVQAMQWANEREKHHVAKRGGVLQDMEETLEQTLNLTSGGQFGDPTARWEAIQAVSARRWHEFQTHYQSYYDREGDGRVTGDHVENGYPLGQTVSSIRSAKHFVSNRPERMEWLQERGWTENERDAKWEDFQKHYQAYYDREGNGRVTKDHVENGYPLGKVVNNIRASRIFVSNRQDRLKWLQERGWVECERDSKWEDFQKHYQAFFDREKHGRVSTDHMEGAYPLGSTVRNVRQGQMLHERPERTEWLRKRGWIKNENDSKWEDFQREYESFYNVNKHGRVKAEYKTKSGYKLGKAVTNIQSQLQMVKGKPDRLQWLQDRRFVMHRTNSAESKRKWAAAWATCPSSSSSLSTDSAAPEHDPSPGQTETDSPMLSPSESTTSASRAPSPTPPSPRSDASRASPTR